VCVKSLRGKKSKGKKTSQIFLRPLSRIQKCYGEIHLTVNCESFVSVLKA